MADDDTWQFELSDLPPLDGEEETQGEGNVAGEFNPPSPVEPEELSLENAVFVLLGIVATLLFLLGPSLDAASLSTTAMLAIAAGVGVVFGVFYRLFTT
ncbi:hypothetical protein VB773_17155 [Haloarculaceae archaeon H-GB2-1]|nr:hypothetical protein [Haloarculaceae archaeon H-GB1-1]MEA5387640.1 hypothetical protein [Haloarculaceae archaeon H-GB11]MEA5409127.1 hypothetical protein [Haloarculaceae archaeon H-GB2-1]